MKPKPHLMRRPGRTAVMAVLLFFHLCVPSAGTPIQNSVQTVPPAQVDEIIRQSGHSLVVMMAAWCTPCIRELPDLNMLSQKYRAKGLKTIGISLDYGGAAAIQPVVDRLKIRFPVYWVGEAGIDHFGITKIPLLLFVREGRIVQRLKGFREKKTLERKIRRFLTAP